MYAMKLTSSGGITDQFLKQARQFAIVLNRKLHQVSDDAVVGTSTASCKHQTSVQSKLSIVYVRVEGGHYGLKLT